MRFTLIACMAHARELAEKIQRRFSAADGVTIRGADRIYAAAVTGVTFN